ncbi:MAG TPA: efflux RND transporter periplasmic adaptor subunit [Xanthobacteraceae bacterium]|nr:efflux RND transporter periplasmic adaptor subunit [Xanthobacteraceae bacterium]
MPSPLSLLHTASIARPRIVAMLALMALAPALAACNDAATSATAPPARPVQVQRVTFAPADESREFAGVVRARYETDLGFRVAGKIVARLVNVGDRVRAGDVVARLDPRDLQLQVESADAELTAATSNLAQAAADELRYQNLRTRGYAAVADYERKKAAKDEAEGRMERAQRALDLAHNQLAYTDLKADADGVITATLAEAGQVVAIGQAVARLAHRGEMEAVVALPETRLSEARQSDASVRLWSDPNRRFSARLRELSPQADAATRTYAARFTIENPDDTVALGMTATVVLSRPADTMIAKVPLAAILNRGTGPTVFRVDDRGMLERRTVTVSSFNEVAALITSGIEDGDEIVTLGVQMLEAGQKVRAILGRALDGR